MTEDLDEKLRLRRLAVFDRVKARIAASGHSMSEEPLFLDLVQRWTEGRVELEEVLNGYSRRTVAKRLREKDSLEEVPPFATESGDAELMADFERVIGMVDLDLPSDEPQR